MRDAQVKHLSYLWGFAGELDVSTPFDALLKSFVRKQKYYKTSVEDFAAPQKYSMVRRRMFAAYALLIWCYLVMLL